MSQEFRDRAQQMAQSKSNEVPASRDVDDGLGGKSCESDIGVTFSEMVVDDSISVQEGEQIVQFEQGKGKNGDIESTPSKTFQLSTRADDKSLFNSSTSSSSTQNSRKDLASNGESSRTVDGSPLKEALTSPSEPNGSVSRFLRGPAIARPHHLPKLESLSKRVEEMRRAMDNQAR